jgi:hypothetical protein
MQMLQRINIAIVEKYLGYNLIGLQDGIILNYKEVSKEFY